MSYLRTPLPTLCPALGPTLRLPLPAVARFRETAVRLLGHPDPAPRPATRRPAGAREPLPGCWDDSVSHIGPGVSE